LFASAAIWRLVGSKKYGNVLIKQLDSPEETLRMIAGTLLTQAGSRSLPLLRDALERQQNLPMLLTMIGDVGDLDQASLLEHYVGDERSDVAKAAREALRVLSSRSK
jgi:hypothetical protein